MQMQSPPLHPGSLMIITGWRGIGKTSLCRVAADLARDAGWTVRGVCSPTRFENGRKQGKDALDLSTQQQRPLAAYAPPPADPEWILDPQTLAWGDAVFRSAVPADLLVVDELGPYELEHGQGWLSALRALDSAQYRLALAVVRPELIPIARQRWPHGEIITLWSAAQAPGLAAAWLAAAA